MIVSTSPADSHLQLDGAEWSDSCMIIQPPEQGAAEVSLWLRESWGPVYEYPGRFRIELAPTGKLLIINEVDVESYVASVVASEIGPNFAEEAFRAQAIVARTFALFLMDRRKASPFDLTAGQGDQVYRGIRRDDGGQRASAATAYTRGIVCTVEDKGNDRVFPAYYSAACGGVSQSAEIFDGNDVAAPLRGGVECDHCRIAPSGSYRWPTFRLSSSEVWGRLLARQPLLAGLGELRAVEVLQRGAGGRPARLRLVGTAGNPIDMLAENFRLAIGANQMRSTFCEMRLVGGEMTFENGRGHGHGLGLCQWGMQGQAKNGSSAADILHYYYPGCKLVKAY